MGTQHSVAYDPSVRVRRGHLPGFAREEVS